MARFFFMSFFMKCPLEIVIKFLKHDLSHKTQ